MRIVLTFVVVLFSAATAAWAAGDVHHPKQLRWQFDGVFGTVDDVSAQRGLKVYREVCANCHGMTRIPFRKLTDIGFSEAEVRAQAAEYTVEDGPNDDGEMFDRPARPSDKFPAPFANEKAARAVNNGAYPPDLSLMVKARPDGANYLYSLLTGYQDAPADMDVPAGQYYNPYFPNGLISMAPPLMDDMIEYEDGTTASVDQMSKDVVNFLQWAAEPEMEERKRMGIRVILFLLVATILFYISKKRIWKDVK